MRRPLDRILKMVRQHMVAKVQVNCGSNETWGVCTRKKKRLISTDCCLDFYYHYQKMCLVSTWVSQLKLGND